MGTNKQRGRVQPLIPYMRRNIYMYIIILVPLVWLFIFRYVPIYGITMAFQDFTFKKGYFRSPWVGLEHFKWLFTRSQFMDAFYNTWVINGLRIVVGFPIPIIMAILINEIRNRAYKRIVQTITYLPHFISWVVLAGIFNSLLARDSGSVNHLLAAIGFQRIDFLQSNDTFRGVIIFTDIWKEFGWGTIIYLAAISGINPELYESAIVDGANRLQQVLFITVPSLVSTMVVVLILRLGSILSIGFEQIFNLYNPLVYETGDIIQTYVMRMLQENPHFSRLAAAGLVQSVIGMVLMLVANRLVRMTGREGIY